MAVNTGPYNSITQAGMEKRSEATADTVSFLSLPPELRNYIYELTIETNRDINFLSVATTGRHQATDTSCIARRCMQAAQQPAVAKVCRFTRAEALPIFYGRNTSTGSLLAVEMPDCCATLSWLKAIGASNRELLKHGDFEWYTIVFLTTPMKRKLEKLGIAYGFHDGVPDGPENGIWTIRKMKFDEDRDTGRSM